MKQTNFPNRKKLRQEEAAARQAATSEMTPEKRLAALDAKFGKDLGAARERTRMLAKIAARKPEPKKEESEEKKAKPKRQAKKDK